MINEVVKYCNTLSIKNEDFFIYFLFRGYLFFISWLFIFYFVVIYFLFRGYLFFIVIFALYFVYATTRINV
jgi:hypothetical protein